VTSEGYFRPIIQSSPADRAVIEAKSGDSHDMKVSSGGGAESRDIARILRDFWFDESDAQHD
jgi:hypothetical protein